MKTALIIGGLTITLISGIFVSDTPDEKQVFASLFGYKCRKENSDRYCSCVWSQLQRQYTVEQIKTLTRVKKGTPIFMETKVYSSCTENAVTVTQ